MKQTPVQMWSVLSKALQDMLASQGHEHQCRDQFLHCGMNKVYKIRKDNYKALQLYKRN